ncbi:MAG: hypothetical protein UU93_C0007G0032 [Candidatus Amesbacteria bacterium GW2011_GWA2_42_12]|uniref:Uncharacterized protein n=1 Tax=Candidatus Amesbacteria bacterium GW2011_GWA2_42_12 TaxID=1618356 RepID=A0A0G0Y6T3_9BACT|nr:MAG: hypothetical protein UU93_C0007G0032 [Candidatus Amesbacteria bacterium GW2011_GWA2_42_12]
MQDQNLTCKDCGNPFVWTAGEQQFYQDKGFTNPPSRCPNCRQNKKASMSGNGGNRQDYPITCSNCGKQDTVPFEPKGDKPVLCRDCFKKNRK